MYIPPLNYLNYSLAEVMETPSQLDPLPRLHGGIADDAVKFLHISDSLSVVSCQVLAVILLCILHFRLLFLSVVLVK